MPKTLKIAAVVFLVTMLLQFTAAGLFSIGYRIVGQVLMCVSTVVGVAIMFVLAFKTRKR